MSRCFPFPPPGYEKKARPDQDATLLIKENQKDKKQKKDKKKEKIDKDKEKSSEKHREKKEKKHKHRDKKEKERDKEKEDKKPSEERKIASLLDLQNSDQRGQSVLPVVETQAGSKLLLDLGKKAGNESNGTREMQIAERIRVPDHSVQSGKVLERNEGTLADSVQNFKDKREENRIPNGHYVNPNATGLANGFVLNLPVKDQKNVEGSGVPGGKVTEKHKERKDSHKHKDGDRKRDKKAGDKERKSKSKDKKRKREKEKEKEKAKANELSGSTPGKLRESDNNAVDCSTDRGSNFSKESSLSHRSINKRKEPEKSGISNGNEIQSNKLLRPASASNQVVQTGQRIDVSNAALQFGQEATVQRINSINKNLPSISVVRNGMKSEMRQNVTNVALERQQLSNNHSKTNNRHSSSVSSPFGNGKNLELGVTIQGESARSSADMEKVAVVIPAVEKKNSPLQIVENGRKFEYDRFNNLASVERQGDVAKLKFTDKGSQSSVPKLDERASKINGVLELKKPTGGAKCERSAPGPQMDIFETPGKPPLELKKPTGGAKCERPAPGLHKDIHEVPVKPPLELKKPTGEAKCERPAPGLHKDIHEAPVKPPLELKKPTGEAKFEKPAPGPDIFETPVKPPHPDLKYLDEILTIPKPVEWSDADDQTWLFSHENKAANKLVKVSSVIEEPKPVWSEAMRIDSADVVALPYVIPF